MLYVVWTVEGRLPRRLETQHNPIKTNTKKENNQDDYWCVGSLYEPMFTPHRLGPVIKITHLPKDDIVLASTRYAKAKLKRKTENQVYRY